jgi:hypothetical protein
MCRILCATAVILRMMIARRAVKTRPYRISCRSRLGAVQHFRRRIIRKTNTES